MKNKTYGKTAKIKGKVQVKESVARFFTDKKQSFHLFCLFRKKAKQNRSKVIFLSSSRIYSIDEINKLVNEPEQVITAKRLQKWAGIQVVKVFLGMPIIPGK